MNMLEAARDTLALARKLGMEDMSSDLSELDYPHLTEMLAKMETCEMSPAKMGRWLGWMQAAVVSGTLGEARLADMKAINMKWSDDPLKGATK